MSVNDYIKIAKITKTHGVRGEVKLFLYTKNIQQYQNFFISENKVEVAFRGFKADNAIAKIEGVDDMDQAKSLQNKFLLIQKTDLPKTSDKSFYYADLIGAKILVNNNVIGEVSDVANYGAGDIITIAFLNNKNEAFPFTDEIFPEIDLKKYEIKFNRPDVI